MAGEVTFQITEDDYIEANREWAFRRWRRPAANNGRQLGWLFAFVGLLIVIALVLKATDYQPDEALIDTALGVALAAFVVWPLIVFFLLPPRARRLFRQQKSLHGPMTYRWTAEGLTYEMEHSKGSTAWTDLHAWRAGKRVLLFFVNERMFYFIPDRVLSGDQRADLEAEAAANVALAL